MGQQECSVESCDHVHYARGLCEMHYKRVRRPLHPDETVHHRNGVRTDNRSQNLELWSTAHPKRQHIPDKVAFAIEMPSGTSQVSSKTARTRR